MRDTTTLMSIMLAGSLMLISGCDEKNAEPTAEVTPAALQAPLTLVSFDSDALVPSWLVEECASHAANARHIRQRSVFGHDAFLKETETLGLVLRGCLASQEVC